MSRKLSSILISVVKNKKMRRLSSINQLLDCLALKGEDDKLVSLHEELRNILDESYKGWPYHDYGEGYFYQSYPSLSIRGLRNTNFRFKFYRLDSILNKNMRVLDIGCNSGFLSLTMAKYCRHLDAFDNNPFLIRIAEQCREYEEIGNVKFSCFAFDEFPFTSTYSVVLSLANHNTFDGNMRPEFRGYLERIRSVMQKGGTLIFESHPGEHKDSFLKENLDSVRDLFQIDSEEVVSTKRSV